MNISNLWKPTYENKKKTENLHILLSPNPFAHVVDEGSRFQKIFYKKSEVGNNIFIKKKSNKYQNVKLDDTTNRTLFILTPLNSVVSIPGLVFFDESSKKMSEENIKKQCNGKAYVILGMAIKNLSIMTKDMCFGVNDINIARKY